MSRLTDDFPRKTRIPVGMIGGGQGAYFAAYHRAAMRLSNRFRLVAGIFSADSKKSRDAGEALEIAPDRVYTDHHAMAAAEAARADAVKAVIVVTPNYLHYEQCKTFLSVDIPVICDKPLTTRLDHALELASLAKQRGLFSAVTYTYCGYPMVRDARARIAAGEIGEVRFVYVEYLLEWLAGDRSKLGQGAVWRGQRDKVGPTSALGDIGTHAFNIVEFVTSARCLKLSARLLSDTPGWELDDTDIVQLSFTGKVEGLLWTSLAAPGHRNGLRFKIVGSKGTLEWVQEAPETLKLSRLDKADKIYRRGLSDMSPIAQRDVSLPGGSPEAYIEALANLYADYADCLDAGSAWRHATETPISDFAEGARGVALIEACVSSHETQQWVAFPDVRPDGSLLHHPIVAT